MWIRWRYIRVEGTDEWNYHELPDTLENCNEEDLYEYLNEDGIRTGYWAGTCHLKGFEWEKVPELPIEQIQRRVELHRRYQDSGYCHDLERFEAMLTEAKKNTEKVSPSIDS